MKILFIAVSLSAAIAHADVVLPDMNITFTNTQIKATVVTNTVTARDINVVWTSLSITYTPPAYTQAVYTVAYHLQDLRTRQEIPRSRGFLRMSESDVAALAAATDIDFAQLAGNIGLLINERLKSLFAQP